MAKKEVTTTTMEKATAITSSPAPAETPIDAGFKPVDTQASRPTAATASTLNPPVWFWIAAVCVALMTGILGFIIGERINTNKTSTTQFGAMNSSSTQHGQSNRTMGGNGGMMRRGGMGSVTAISSTSITVKDRMSNSTTTYTINDSTKFYKLDRASGSVSDIRVGDSVMVQTSSSSSSSSSSQTATSISLVDMTQGPRGNQTSTDSSSSSSADSNASTI